MDDFSRVYEKLVDMGFSANSIDCAIEDGLYTFEDIFNSLVDKEQQRIAVGSPSSDSRKQNSADDGRGSYSLDRYEGLSGGWVGGEGEVPRMGRGRPQAPESDQGGQVTRDRLDLDPREGPCRREEDVPRPLKTGSSSLSSAGSSVSLDSSARNMARIQIMDLLDPSLEPRTYCQPFLASVCSVRDLVCWFCQSRSTGARRREAGGPESRVAIPPETDTHTLISLFGRRKWHLVLPGGAGSRRIYGEEQLDLYLEDLGLLPSAHLLAIVGCPLALGPPPAPVLSPSAGNNSNSVQAEGDCQPWVTIVDYGEKWPKVTERALPPGESLEVSWWGQETAAPVLCAFPGEGLRLEGGLCPEDGQGRILAPGVAVPPPLFRLCLAGAARAIRVRERAVCRRVRRLPDPLQQLLLRALRDAEALCPQSLAVFCRPGACLRCLDLSHWAGASNEALRVVARCRSLEELLLDNEGLTFSGEGLLALAALTRLRLLSLSHCRGAGDGGIQVLPALPRLSVLGLRRTAVTDAGLQRLHIRLGLSTAVPILASLDLTGLPLSDEAIPLLASLPGLLTLTLADTHIQDPRCLPPLAHLAHLDLSHCRRLRWPPDTPGDVLAARYPRLVSVSVRGARPDDVAVLVAAVGACGGLTRVEGLLGLTGVTPAHLASLCRLPLETVHLAACPHLEDAHLPALASLGPSLGRLVLSACPRLRGLDDALIHNLGRLHSLLDLDLSRLDNVDPGQMVRLVLAAPRLFPRLQTLHLSLPEEEEAFLREHVALLPFQVRISRLVRSPINLIDGKSPPPST